MEPWKNELYHYGVKGMRWGVRKARQTSEKKPREKGEWKKKAAKRIKYHAKATLLGYQQYRKALGTFAVSSFFGAPLSSPALSSYKKIGQEYIDNLRALRKEMEE